MCLRKKKLKWKLKLGQIFKFTFSSDCDEIVFVSVGQSNPACGRIISLVLLCILYTCHFWQSRLLHLWVCFYVIALLLIKRCIHYVEHTNHFFSILVCSVPCINVISDNLDPQRASQISPMWYPANLCPAYCYNYIQGWNCTWCP